MSPATTAVRAPAIALAHLTKTYPGGTRALDDVSLTVAPGTFLAVMGPSGSGKSTLMHCAAGLDTPTSGSVRIDGTEIAGLGETRRTELRRERVGFVFQAYNLIPSLSIEDNITLPLRLAGRTPDRQWIGVLVERVGLAARLRHRPAELSGGQQQRLCIARSLAVRPRVLLMDEPCSALDPTSTRRIEETIAELKSEVTIVIVTHNMQQAARVSDACAFFLAAQGTPGVIVEHGDTDAMFNSPRDERTLDYVNGRFG